MVTKIHHNTNLQCNLPHALDPTSKSLTNSYVKNDVAMLGATFTVYPVPTNQPLSILVSDQNVLTQIWPEPTIHPPHSFCLENNACCI